MSFRAKACALALALFAWTIVHGQTTLDEVHTVGTADTGVPVERSFSVGVAGRYQVTLTDLGGALTPTAPLASVQLAITRDAQIIGTPLTAAGSFEFDATVGTYVVRVTGNPGTVAGSGPIGLQVTSVSNSTTLFSSVENLALPPKGLPVNQAVVDTSFTVATQADYVFTLTDLQFPQALNVVTALLTPEGGGTPVILPLQPSGAFTTTVNLVPGNYRVFAVGRAASGPAGVYTVSVAPAAGGAAVVDRTVPIGLVSDLGAVSLGAGSQVLSLADLNFPTALTQRRAIVVCGGQQVAAAAAPGDVTFNLATAQGCRALGYGAAAAAGAGSYAVIVRPQGGNPVLKAYETVTDAAYTGTGYSYDVQIANAGTYRARLADFQFPLAAAALNAAVVQDLATVGTPLTAAGTTDAQLNAGKAGLLLFARPASPQGNLRGGLLGLDLTASGGGTPVFSVTQGVGALFAAHQINIAAAGRYEVNLTDVGFPAAFADLDAAVTRDAQSVGSIFGGGKFAFDATPGAYFVNLIAQAGTSKAGTYSLTVATAPPLPVVNLSATPGTVQSGSGTTLTWSTQNATSCTASGAWTGSKATNGTEVSAALTTASTFTLVCTGAGGSTSANTSVSIDAARQSDGGGGSLDVVTALLLLVVLLAYRRRLGPR